MPRTTIEPTIASEHEAVLAHEATRAIEAIEASEAAGKIGVRMLLTQAGHEVTTLDMPPAAVSLIRRLLKEMGEGKAVTLVAGEPGSPPSRQPSFCTSRGPMSWAWWTRACCPRAMSASSAGCC